MQCTTQQRAYRALLRAVAFTEPQQSALLQKYCVRLAGLHALRVLRDLGTVPSNQFAEVLEIHGRAPPESSTA